MQVVGKTSLIVLKPLRSIMANPLTALHIKVCLRKDALVPTTPHQITSIANTALHGCHAELHYKQLLLYENCTVHLCKCSDLFLSVLNLQCLRCCTSCFSASFSAHQQQLLITDIHVPHPLPSPTVLIYLSQCLLAPASQWVLLVTYVHMYAGFGQGIFETAEAPACYHDI